MKFVVSYSSGKDSILALHKMVEKGHTPVALLVMVHTTVNRSWFHGASRELLECIADSLKIPLLCCESSGTDYNVCFEEGLKAAKQKGAEACVFGDVDIAEHRAWGTERCKAVGLKARFPLWEFNRLQVVMEVISLGYECVIKCVQNDCLPARFLGQLLDEDKVIYMISRGIDLCGENGEYHTIVVGGPLFHKPITCRCDMVIDFGDVSAVDIVLIKKE